MPRSRGQLWFIAFLFAAMAVAGTLAYQRFRAGDIQLAEGRRAYDAGRFDLAEKAFERSVTHNPRNAGAWYWLGLSRKNQGRSAEAAEAFARATALQPQNVLWWMELAQCLQWAERFAEAEPAWDRVLQGLPGNDARRREAGIHRAKCLAGLGRTDQAVQALETLLAEDNSPPVRFALAEVLAWAGRFDDSEAQYRMAIDAASPGSQPETRP